MWTHLGRFFGKKEHQTSLEGRVSGRKMGAVTRGSGVDVGKMLLPSIFISVFLWVLIWTLSIDTMYPTSGLRKYIFSFLTLD